MLIETLKCFSVLLFLLFFPRATALAPPNNPKANPSYSTAVLVVGLSVAHAFIMALTNMIVVAKSPDHLQGYSSAVGVLAAILASIQYLPQIYTTWSLGRAASLSIPMMCLQTPGGYLWAGSQAVRLGWAGWSVWGILLVTATMQGILLIMAIFFELKIRRGKTAGLDSSDSSTAVGEESNGEARENDEETPLIGNER